MTDLQKFVSMYAEAGIDFSFKEDDHTVCIESEVYFKGDNGDIKFGYQMRTYFDFEGFLVEQVIYD